MSYCKNVCDSQESCKGYTENQGGDVCQIATTSDCPSVCSLYEGSTGSLDPNAACGGEGTWNGCYIKERKS